MGLPPILPISWFIDYDHLKLHFAENIAAPVISYFGEYLLAGQLWWSKNNNIIPMIFSKQEVYQNVKYYI